METYSFGGPFGHRYKTMNILDGSEGFLPKLEIGSNIELIKSGVKMSLKCVWIIEIYRVRLIGIFGDIL